MESSEQCTVTKDEFQIEELQLKELRDRLGRLNLDLRTRDAEIETLTQTIRLLRLSAPPRKI